MTYYEYLMPETLLKRSEDRSKGWACAQNRPLRALGLVLMLVMILLCDDDTYVNFELFHRLKSQLRNRLNSVGEAPPVARVMGAMMFRQMLTLAGFIPGGGGYTGYP
jgi:hypothetical protein